MSEEPEVTVRDVPDASRFEAYVGGELAGFTEYERRDGRVIFPHTEVDDAFEGRGVGGALARGALDAMRAQGEQIVPLCPFIAGFIDRHEEYADLVDLEMTVRMKGG